MLEDLADRNVRPTPAESSTRIPASLHCMTKIHIPTPLRQYAGKQADVAVKAGTVAEALSQLVSEHPDLRRHLYTDDGKLRSFVNVYLNDEDVRYLQKEATVVKDSDTISIVPSIAGGCSGLRI
ncbi:MAG TPA: ubiquitin-like small modifier protein 1 [Terriglobales bacterium]|nr:ubiquitin-like small modifier protein 1 [Terriglobales bacterium]